MYRRLWWWWCWFYCSYQICNTNDTKSLFILRASPASQQAFASPPLLRSFDVFPQSKKMCHMHKAHHCHPRNYVNDKTREKMPVVALCPWSRSKPKGSSIIIMAPLWSLDVWPLFFLTVHAFATLCFATQTLTPLLQYLPTPPHTYSARWCCLRALSPSVACLPATDDATASSPPPFLRCISRHQQPATAAST